MIPILNKAKQPDSFNITFHDIISFLTRNGLSHITSQKDIKLIRMLPKNNISILFMDKIYFINKNYDSEKDQLIYNYLDRNFRML